jgi:hypothetical protein
MLTWYPSLVRKLSVEALLAPRSTPGLRSQWTRGVACSSAGLAAECLAVVMNACRTSSVWKERSSARRAGRQFDRRGEPLNAPMSAYAVVDENIAWERSIAAAERREPQLDERLAATFK